MQIDQVKELIELLDHTSIQELEFEHKEFKLTLKKQGALMANMTVTSAPIPAAAPVAAPSVANVEPAVVATETNYKTIESPMVGTFYSKPSPEKPAFVQVGTQIAVGQVVCIVEAMKLFNDVEAEISGEIVEVLVNDGDLVEFGQPLFKVK